MIYILLAQGFEEIEAISTIDILRRCNIEVKVVSAGNNRQIPGAHGIVIKADTQLTKVNADEADCVILPGGMPGTTNLLASPKVKKLLLKMYEKGKTIAAICAAPMILGKYGMLAGRNATCYPGFEEYLYGAEHVNEKVVVDRNIITANGPGAATEFAFAIAEMFVDKKNISKVKKGMGV